MTTGRAHRRGTSAAASTALHRPHPTRTPRPSPATPTHNVPPAPQCFPPTRQPPVGANRARIVRTHRHRRKHAFRWRPHLQRWRHRQLLPRQVAPPTRQRTANPHPARRPRQPHTDRREHTPRRRRRPLLSGTPTHNRLIHPQPTRNIPTHTHSGEPTARHRTHTRTVITPTPTHHLAARLQSTPHPRPQTHRHEPVIRHGLAAAGRRDLHALRRVTHRRRGHDGLPRGHLCGTRGNLRRPNRRIGADGHVTAARFWHRGVVARRSTRGGEQPHDQRDDPSTAAATPSPRPGPHEAARPDRGAGQ